jgi:protein involved in polysaccharide export with SLBB domain
MAMHKNRRWSLVAGPWLLAVIGCVFLCGCAAMTNPVVDGIPVHRLPPELLATPRNDTRTIPLALLEQPQPAVYLLEPGDVLALYIEGILGERTQPIPINAPPVVQIRDQHTPTPTLGYPVPVRQDGTIALPWVKPIRVQGLTIIQAQDAVTQAYRVTEIGKEGKERIYVNLFQPRRSQVLVLREESTSFAPTLDGAITSSKLGTGSIVELPAFENDVLHALTLTGGLPGLDAYDAVIIERGCFSDAAQGGAVQKRLTQLLPGMKPQAVLGCDHPIVRIPLRIHPGEPLPIRPEDVVLHTGDVVFIEARPKDVYFTGGLLPAAEHVLPRDKDLDVLEAVSLVHGPLINGAFAVNNLAGNLVQPGLGGPNPSLLTVLRRTPEGGQVAIRVDLNRALRDARERLLVKAGDVLILQEQPGEALARYFSQTFLNFDLFWQVIHTPYATGALDVSAPDRLPGRIAVENLIPPQ